MQPLSSVPLLTFRCGCSSSVRLSVLGVRLLLPRMPLMTHATVCCAVRCRCRRWRLIQLRCAAAMGQTEARGDGAAHECGVAIEWSGCESLRVECAHSSGSGLTQCAGEATSCVARRGEARKESWGRGQRQRQRADHDDATRRELSTGSQVERGDRRRGVRSGSSARRAQSRRVQTIAQCMTSEGETNDGNREEGRRGAFRLADARAPASLRARLGRQVTATTRARRR